MDKIRYVMGFDGIEHQPRGFDGVAQKYVFVIGADLRLQRRGRSRAGLRRGRSRADLRRGRADWRGVLAGWCGCLAVRRGRRAGLRRSAAAASARTGESFSSTATSGCVGARMIALAP